MITKVSSIGKSFIFPDSAGISLDGLEEAHLSYEGSKDDASRLESRQLLSKDIHIGHHQISLQSPINFNLRRNTDAIQMIFVLKGSYQLKSKNRTVASLQSLEHNMLYLTAGMTEVPVGSDEELEFVEIHLALPFVERYISSDHELHRKISSARSAPLSERHMQLNPQIQGVLNDLICCELEGNLKSLYVRAKVIELLSLQLARFNASDFIDESGLSSRDIEKMNRVRDLITASPEITYSLAHLARLAGTNEQYLKRHFKMIYGKTVFNYLHSFRMERAKELLLSGDKKVSEIAQEVGYQHPTHFTQAFKKYFGYLPARVRGSAR
jgi:AraC-like DNA-binding protein